MASFPPYWPFQCRECARFVSNPRITFRASSDPWNDVVIDTETGDCSKCGKRVALKPLGYDDWFYTGRLAS
jgi:hypothetical protein